ncbi:hypothetical protein SAMN04488127_2919 [Bhargavaea ginsengi]|uniref:Tubby C-terminal domain-containing protein n=1 Tax=Bhargavaea ginsengi TaxID=426757 RepID=A0A1H7BYK4_9BACL|nr:hypothetical protein [Bhargavaea ginsengi]SEJ82286.1 hypothetical protein SAMN04488127_2919 [Bhargavaea ginsengi]
MKIYTYQLPLTKGSTQEVTLYDESEKPQYLFKRVYKSFFHQIFDGRIGNFQFLSEFHGYDLKGNKVVRAYNKYSLTSSETLLQLDKESLFIAKFEGFNSITPTYHIKSEVIQIFSTIDTKRFVQFYEDKQLIASIQLYFKPNIKSELKLYSAGTIQNPLFYVLCAQIFYFVGEY